MDLGQLWNHQHSIVLAPLTTSMRKGLGQNKLSSLCSTAHNSQAHLPVSAHLGVESDHLRTQLQQALFRACALCQWLLVPCTGLGGQ